MNSICWQLWSFSSSCVINWFDQSVIRLWYQNANKQNVMTKDFFSHNLCGNFKQIFPATTQPCLTLPAHDINMVMNVTSVTLNSTLTFSCMVGYELHGNDAMVCGNDGKWLGQVPSCISMKLASRSFWKYIVFSKSIHLYYEVSIFGNIWGGS